MPRLGVTVVGAGYRGTDVPRNFPQSPDFRLHWLCDVQEYRARSVRGSYSTVRTAASLADVLADEAVDCVAVATPARTHHDVAAQAPVRKVVASSSVCAYGLATAFPTPEGHHPYANDGSQTMDFVHVHDVARSNLSAETLLAVMDSDVSVKHVPVRTVNGVTRRLADTRKAAEMLRSRAEVALDEGLRRLVDWWRAKRAASVAG